MSRLKHNARILMIDLETAPNKVYAWGFFNQNIYLDQVVEPGYTLCFAARWYGAPAKETEFRSVHHDGMDVMLDRAWELMNEADLVVHYNGKSFDVPTLNREFIKHEYRPPSDTKQVDLLHVVRRQFRFASNKLDFVAQQLGIGKKLPHKGMELWHECMEGDEKAWRTMRRYNIQDTALLIDLYERLRPWIPQHPNLGLYVDDPEHPTCPNCGSQNLKKNGTRKTQVRRYQRYECLDCGAWPRGRKALEIAPDGVLMT